MIVVKKKIKKPLLIAILAGALALMTVLAILLNTLLAANAGKGEDNNKNKIEVDTELGESVYNGEAIAYLPVAESTIQYIKVKGEREYSFIRGEEEEGSDKTPPFYLSYVDDNGKEEYYLPPILEKDPTIDYEDFYAVTQDDMFGEIYKLSYLCSALGYLYFNDRLEVSPYYGEQEKVLVNYGLADSDNPIELYFVYNYKGEDGKTAQKSHKIRVGDKLINGKGYYFMVDTRPVVYSTNVNYLDYAFLNFTDYISPILTARGLAQDNAFEPYLTTGYEQWKNTVYDEEGREVADNSTVVVDTLVYTPGSKEEYSVARKDIMTDLAELGSDLNAQRLRNVLKGSKIGAFASPVYVTLTSQNKFVEFGEKQTINYKYRIIEIESILTDRADITESGTVVGDNDLIKVKYVLYVDGKEDLGTYRGVIDLSSDLIDDSTEALLRASAIGNLPEDVNLELNYTVENTVKRTVKMAITEVIEIIDLEDMVTRVDKVAKGTRVLFRYQYVVDGVVSENLISDYVDITDDMTEDNKLIADALMDLEVGEYTDKYTEDYVKYAERMDDFVTYGFSVVEYFIVGENIVSFMFEQASKRDPYYGESLYTNTMENKYAMYALHSGACEAVVEVLGGINDDATASNGLVGIKVVDMNITPEKLKKYGPKNSNKGLYAHKVYFELPRGITSIEYADDGDGDDGLNDLDDYTYYSTLGFTLWISEADPVTGQRYIASDLYDVIALVDGEKFVFLDQNFPDFYARKNLVLTDVSNINRITAEFFMDDVYGTYVNKLIHNHLYAYDGRLYYKENLTDEQLSMASPYDAIEVTVTPHGNCIETELSRYIDKNGVLTDADGNKYASLRELYGAKEFRDMDSEGTANFKEFIQTLFLTEYEKSLSEEEQAAGKDAECLMRLRVNLVGDSHEYVYEFRRISDRRVMVTIYQESGEGVHTRTVVSDFFISTFSFKKLVNNYFMLLNAEMLDNDLAYPDGIK